MKKIVVLVLCLSMVFMLCACGKSKEAQAVDDLIMAIGEVSIESAEKIESAETAYNELNDKDKANVENYQMLEDAKNTLENIRYCALANRIKSLNEDSDIIAEAIYNIWDFVGPDLVYNALVCINGIKDETPLEAYRASQAGEESDWDSVWSTVVGVVKYTIYEDSSFFEDISEDTVAETVSYCISFNMICDEIVRENTALADDVKAFRKNCSDDYKEAMDNMNEWYLDSSLYAEFAMNPSGSLSSYGAQKAEYSEKINRYQKIAESYE